MKSSIKQLLRFIAMAYAYPFIFLVRVFPFYYKFIAIRLSGLNGYYGVLVREIFYKRTLHKCGLRLKVHYGAFFVYPTAEVGDDVTVEEYCVVSNCSIGDDVILAARVSIMSGSRHHDVNDLNSEFRNSKSFSKKVHIDNNVWVGTHAVIMDDVGANTVIGAGSIVNKPIPA